MGAVLMRKPEKLARLVAGIAADSALPLTVKLRTGAKGVSETNLGEVRHIGAFLGDEAKSSCCFVPP